MHLFKKNLFYFIFVQLILFNFVAVQVWIVHRICYRKIKVHSWGSKQLISRVPFDRTTPSLSQSVSPYLPRREIVWRSQNESHGGCLEPSLWDIRRMCEHNSVQQGRRCTYRVRHYARCTGTVVTDVDFGKMIFIGCTWGTLLSDVYFGKLIIY